MSTHTAGLHPQANISTRRYPRLLVACATPASHWSTDMSWARSVTFLPVLCAVASHILLWLTYFRHSWQRDESEHKLQQRPLAANFDQSRVGTTRSEVRVFSRLFFFRCALNPGSLPWIPGIGCGHVRSNCRSSLPSIDKKALLFAVARKSTLFNLQCAGWTSKAPRLIFFIIRIASILRSSYRVCLKEKFPV